MLPVLVVPSKSFITSRKEGQGFILIVDITIATRDVRFPSCFEYSWSVTGHYIMRFALHSPQNIQLFALVNMLRSLVFCKIPFHLYI